MFIYFAVVSSLMVSSTKACAEGSGIECKTKVVACLEHVILLVTELLTHIGTRALAPLVVSIQYRPLWNA